MLAFNLFALMRQALDASCESMRIETFRRRPCCRAGKIVRHARGRALKLCDARAARRLSEAVGMIARWPWRRSRPLKKMPLRPGTLRTVIDLSPCFRPAASSGSGTSANPPGIAAASTKISPRLGFRRKFARKNL